MAAKCIFMVFIIGIPLWFTSAVPKPQDCTTACLVEIEGLRNTYSPGSRVEVKIHNQAEQRVDVNVAVEGLESGLWVEVVGSVSDPQHSLSKMLILSPIKTSASLRLTFDPCKTPIIVKNGNSLEMADRPCSKPSGEGMPTSLRLRVDVHVRNREGIVQRVRSHEFRLVAAAKSPCSCFSIFTAPDTMIHLLAASWVRILLVSKQGLIFIPTY